MRILQNSGVPIYQQIAEQMKAYILAGKMKQGEYLPSIRSLAKELKISVITTMKAYELLEAIAAAKIAGMADKELIYLVAMIFLSDVY